MIVLPQKLMPMKDVTVFDINRDRLTLFEEKFGVRTAASLPDAVEEAEVVCS
jgi:3-hydroxyisobutyrate dehydrogenase-like beta-hydroxyacid dehydrogenase